MTRSEVELLLARLELDVARLEQQRAPTCEQESVGMPDGVLRPEYGPGIEDLKCCTCGATWCGVRGDPCWWCERSAQIQIEHQIDLLLAVPEIDPADINYEARMGAWADRMIVGEKAGLITQRQADTAWQRATRRAKAS